MTDHQKKLHRAANHLRIVTWVGAFVISLVVVIGWGALHPGPKSFDPLRFPDQKVLSKVDGIKGPAALPGDFVNVTAVKCNLSSKPVGIIGTYEWVAVDPPGAIIEGGHGAAVRQPGCISFNYKNVIPAAVLAEAKERGPRSRWIISGSEKPTNAYSVARVYRSEPFTIVTP
jgi:hypothetical protein